jgi:SAM-dependent methyltransferase
MSQLYTTLSGIYEAMYQSFINYEEEFLFYEEILKKFKRNNVLELGCGTGNMAGRFINKTVSYTGIDLSDEMLKIALDKHPHARFLKYDMRDFNLNSTFDFCFAAGRTVSYLLTNNDVYNSFNCIYKHLTEDGIICFDFIDAGRFIPLIQKGKQVVHRVSYKNKNYKRISNWEINLSESYTFNWESLYYEVDHENNESFLGKDHSVIRTFTKNDIELFLKICGFEVLEFRDKPSYAFDTFVTVAQKKAK